MTSWSSKSLAEVADVIRGVTFDKSEVRAVSDEARIPILRAGNIQDSLNTDTDLVYVPKNRVSTEQRLQRGDLVICMSSGSAAIVGKSARLDDEWTGSVGAFCAIIRFEKEVNYRFGAYWFKSEAFRAWRNANAKGANIQNLRRSDLEIIELPVPPLAEQERIVALLDEADALRKLRAQADHRTADLIPALFHDMFGDPTTNPFGWPLKHLPELCVTNAGIKAGPFGSSLKKDTYTTSGPRVYGQEQVISDDFSVGNYRISLDKYSEMFAYAVTSGDILVSLVGTFGKIAVVPSSAEAGIINPRLVRIRLNKTLMSPFYLAAVMSSESFKGHLETMANGGTMGVLNATLLKRLYIPVPPLELQKDFAAKVAEVENLNETQTSSSAMIDTLFDSILSRAFFDKS